MILGVRYDMKPYILYVTFTEQSVLLYSSSIIPALVTHITPYIIRSSMVVPLVLLYCYCCSSVPHGMDVQVISPTLDLHTTSKYFGALVEYSTYNTSMYTNYNIILEVLYIWYSYHEPSYSNSVAVISYQMIFVYGIYRRVSP